MNSEEINGEKDLTRKERFFSKDETLLNDPVLLRVAIQRCRLDCVEAERRLTKLKNDHRDFVPKSDFLQLEQTHGELMKANEQMKQTFRNTKVEYNSLIEALEHLIKDRDKYFHLCENYRATLTPRPDWDRCGPMIEGGIDRWNELTIGKTSNERVDLLLNEIIGGNDIYNNVRSFVGLGLGPTIPTFLQTTANIPNRHFIERDVVLLIDDIWRKKNDYDHERSETFLLKRRNSSRTSFRNENKRKTVALIDFLHFYFKQRFPDDEFLQLEWGYNLVASCQRFSFNEKIKHFWKILSGEEKE